MRLPGGPASAGGDVSHAAGLGAAYVGSAVAAAAGVPAGLVRVTRLVEEATGWSLTLPVSAGTRVGWRRQRLLQAAPPRPPLGPMQEALWRYEVEVALASAALPAPLDVADLEGRLASSTSAPVWRALASLWADASGQAVADVQAQLAVSVPAGGTPAGSQLAAGAASPPGISSAVVIGIAVASSAALAVLLLSAWRYVRVVRPAKFRGGLPVLSPSAPPPSQARPGAGGASNDPPQPATSPTTGATPPESAAAIALDHRAADGQERVQSGGPASDGQGGGGEPAAAAPVVADSDADPLPHPPRGPAALVDGAAEAARALNGDDIRSPGSAAAASVAAAGGDRARAHGAAFEPLPVDAVTGGHGAQQPAGAHPAGDAADATTGSVVAETGKTHTG